MSTVIPCGRLNNVPHTYSGPHPRSLPLNPCSPYMDKGLREWGQLKDPEMGKLPGLSTWNLNVIRSVLRRRAEEELTGETEVM